MKKTVQEIVVKHKVVSIICDCCKREYDDMELQEFLSCSTIGGYNSVFGDGVSMSFDLCQYCVKELLGKYIQFHDDEEEEEESE